MKKDILCKAVAGFIPNIISIDIKSELGNDDQHAYLVLIKNIGNDHHIETVLFVNGMSGEYSEDEAIMILTGGRDILGWFYSDGSGRIIPHRVDKTCQYRLPLEYGYDTYFTLAEVKSS